MPAGTTTHVSLNSHEYLVKPYSYIKRRAPDFGPRFATGDPDFNNLSMWQHWAQKCFIGGMGQEEWSDDAMFHESVGVNTMEHERLTLARDLSRGSGSNWALNATAITVAGHKAFIYNDKLYDLVLPAAGSEGELWEYSPSTDGWTRITGLDAANITPRSVTTFDAKVWIAGVAVGTTTPKLIWSNSSLGTWQTITNPAGVPSGAIYSMKAFQRKLYVAYGTNVWRLKEDRTWDGNTVFYKADQNSESIAIWDMEVHLGFLYMLSRNGHVHRTDGNSTFDIWNWDGQTYGVAIQSFDGRLFILTFEFTNTADVGWGVLYQMSGSAVTQLKRWGDENAAYLIGNMTVYDRHLFYGASNMLGIGNRSGFGVMVYDPIEDSHNFFAENSDTVTYSKGSTPFRNDIVEDQIVFGGYMFVFVRAHGGFKTPYRHRDREFLSRRYDMTANGGSLDSTNGGWLTTSTYDAGTPGVKKLWRKISVDCTILTNTGIVVDYSTNAGTTWVKAATLNTVAGRTNVQIWLNNIISTSIKLRFTLRSTTATSTPQMFGFVVSYLPVPEPNWMWTFTIVLAETIQAQDGSGNVTFDTEAEMTFLEDLYRNKQLVTYIDIDGVTWATNGPGVLVHDIEFRVAQMSQPLEGEVVITLIEAVETY